MARFSRILRHNRQPQPLPVAAFVDLLPDEPYEAIARWPYSHLPLTFDKDFHDSFDTIKGDEAVVRGRIIRPYQSASHSEVALAIGNAASSQQLYLRIPDSAPFWQLIGMTVEFGCTLEDLTDPTGNSREGTLVSVHGIEMPLKPGDTDGKARGRVVHVIESDHSAESYGMDLDIGADVIAISWNPSISLPIREAGILDRSGLVIISLSQQGSSPVQYQHRGGIKYTIAPF